MKSGKARSVKEGVGVARDLLPKVGPNHNMSSSVIAGAEGDSPWPGLECGSSRCRLSAPGASVCAMAFER